MDKYSALQYTNALQIFVKVQNIRTNGLGKKKCSSVYYMVHFESERYRVVFLLVRP